MLFLPQMTPAHAEDVADITQRLYNKARQAIPSLKLLPSQVYGKCDSTQNARQERIKA